MGALKLTGTMAGTMKMKKYRVEYDHAMNEGERETVGTFDTYEEAVACVRRRYKADYYDIGCDEELFTTERVNANEWDGGEDGYYIVEVEE